MTFLSDENKNNFTSINNKLEKSTKADSYLQNDTNLLEQIEKYKTAVLAQQNKAKQLKDDLHL